MYILNILRIISLLLQRLYVTLLIILLDIRDGAVKMDSDDINKEAKFNSGIQKLYRIGKLKEGCHDARRFNYYSLWFSCLQGIRSEMNAKMTKDKKESYDSERDKADEFENAIKKYLDNKKNEMVSVDGKKGKVSDINIYDLLYNYELWLGDIEEKYKFGMPDQEDDEGL
jgi:hypothetical protein